MQVHNQKNVTKTLNFEAITSLLLLSFYFIYPELFINLLYLPEGLLQGVRNEGRAAIQRESFKVASRGLNKNLTHKNEGNKQSCHVGLKGKVHVECKV